MWVAKVLTKKGEQFFEVLKVSAVEFDSRQGWVLLAIPVGGSKTKEIMLEHPGDSRFEWVREFRF